MNPYDYHSRRSITILVPIRIRYYDVPDILIDFQMPEHGEIANAMREDRARKDTLRQARALIEIAKELVKDQNPLAAQQLQEADDKLVFLLEPKEPK